MEVVAVIVVAAALVAGLPVAYRRLFVRVTVHEYERALRYDRGRFSGLLEPGAYTLVRHRSSAVRVDTRATIATLAGQEVITSDGVSIRISLTAEYEVVDPVTAVNGHSDYRQALHVALQLALREATAAAEIDDLLARRAELGTALLERARGEVERLGLRLLRVEARDFMFPGELRRSFAQVVAARKEGLAALERARGETAALRNLANAARTIEGNPMLLQLRLLQELGRAGGNTVVLGLPASTTPLPLRDAPPGELPDADAGGRSEP